MDGEKYYMERRRLEGSELRRARAPLLRFLVRLALKCDNAEELGKRLRRRYQRQQQRQDLVRPGRAETDAEIERSLAD